MRQLGAPTASVHWAETRNAAGQRISRAMDLVVLRAPLEGLKGRPLAAATLTPAEARHLALELLAAAERAEKNGQD